MITSYRHVKVMFHLVKPKRVGRFQLKNDFVQNTETLSSCSVMGRSWLENYVEEESEGIISGF
jgi:hypothetical protein